jgi:sugar phosphate permease
MDGAGSAKARRPNRWLILGFGLAAQASTAAFLYGIPTLIPELRDEYHLTLAGAGWVVAAPTIGLLCTLIAWGAAADRYGERKVMVIGLGLTTLFISLAVPISNLGARTVLLGLAGAASGSVNAASGRVVLGWFGPRERGIAMGARQTAQPLGVGLAALVLPLIGTKFGVGWALVFPAGFCFLAVVLVFAFVVDPPRQLAATAVASGSPYRSPTLFRLHAASTLLVVPQFAVSAFTLTYLVTERHWTSTQAGRLIFAFQVLGAAGRLAAGWWSDRADSRLGPMRIVAGVSALSMLAVALGDHTGSPLVIGALGVAAVISVADNGLGFTAAAELAGTAWAGRALGAQNTAQNVASALTPPLLGALIGGAGYASGFAVTAIFPVLAMFATPVTAEMAARHPLASSASTVELPSETALSADGALSAEGALSAKGALSAEGAVSQDAP